MSQFASERLVAALNSQVGNEFGASMQYLEIASYFDSESLPALKEFFYSQADEERQHAMKFVHFINDVGGPLEIPQISAPKAGFDSAEEAVAKALSWEMEVTAQINQLMAIARDETNHLAMKFLDWFVGEQMEEVNTMNELLSLIQRAGADRMLDIEAHVARTGHPEDVPA